MNLLLDAEHGKSSFHKEEDKLFIIYLKDNLIFLMRIRVPEIQPWIN